MNNAERTERQIPAKNKKNPTSVPGIQEYLSLVKHKFVVMSCKNGVGRTSAAANLAVSLSKKGAKVGLIDVDITGPEIKRVLGIEASSEIGSDGRFIPISFSTNLKIASIESLINDALNRKESLKVQTIRRLISTVRWENLDYLIVDPPYGFSDSLLTVAEMIPDAKAIIITTPEASSLADLRSAIDFCESNKMPIIGLIENMRGFLCYDCDKPHDTMISGGACRDAIITNIPYLGRIPIDTHLKECMDTGEYYLEKYPESEVALSYDLIAERILEYIYSQ